MWIKGILVITKIFAKLRISNKYPSTILDYFKSIGTKYKINGPTYLTLYLTEKKTNNNYPGSYFHHVC